MPSPKSSIRRLQHLLDDMFRLSSSSTRPAPATFLSSDIVRAPSLSLVTDACISIGCLYLHRSPDMGLLPSLAKAPDENEIPVMFGRVPSNDSYVIGTGRPLNVISPPTHSLTVAELSVPTVVPLTLAKVPLMKLPPKVRLQAMFSSGAPSGSKVALPRDVSDTVPPAIDSMFAEAELAAATSSAATAAPHSHLRAPDMAIPFRSTARLFAPPRCPTARADGQNGAMILHFSADVRPE